MFLIIRKMQYMSSDNWQLLMWRQGSFSYLLPTIPLWDPIHAAQPTKLCAYQPPEPSLTLKPFLCQYKNRTEEAKGNTERRGALQGADPAAGSTGALFFLPLLPPSLRVVGRSRLNQIKNCMQTSDVKQCWMLCVHTNPLNMHSVMSAKQTTETSKRWVSLQRQQVLLHLFIFVQINFEHEPQEWKHRGNKLNMLYPKHYKHIIYIFIISFTCVLGTHVHLLLENHFWI